MAGGVLHFSSGRVEMHRARIPRRFAPRNDKSRPSAGNKAAQRCGDAPVRLDWLRMRLNRQPPRNNQTPQGSQNRPGLQHKIMTSSGKLIAIEGIDGSGKHTQVELLMNTLRVQGHSVYATGFPQYDSWFGKMVGQFLNGELGPLENVDPHFTALLYAGDRYEAKPKLEAALSNGQIVLADRYIASNLAHQTARAAPENRAAFVEWIEHLEYVIYGLPREDLVLYLRVPPAEAQKLVAQKAQRSYTSAQKDLQEASLRHLEDAAQMYDSLSKRPNWNTIECFDAKRTQMRAAETIAKEVLGAVLIALSVLPQSTMKGGR
jgi:dTMP kinase